jgi:hypothetical protein
MLPLAKPFPQQMKKLDPWRDLAVPRIRAQVKRRFIKYGGHWKNSFMMQKTSALAPRHHSRELHEKIILRPAQNPPIRHHRIHFSESTAVADSEVQFIGQGFLSQGIHTASVPIKIMTPTNHISKPGSVVLRGSSRCSQSGITTSSENTDALLGRVDLDLCFDRSSDEHGTLCDHNVTTDHGHENAVTPYKPGVTCQSSMTIMSQNAELSKVSSTLVTRLSPSFGIATKRRRNVYGRSHSARTKFEFELHHPKSATVLVKPKCTFADNEALSIGSMRPVSEIIIRKNCNSISEISSVTSTASLDCSDSSELYGSDARSQRILSNKQDICQTSFSQHKEDAPNAVSNVVAFSYLKSPKQTVAFAETNAPASCSAKDPGCKSAVTLLHKWQSAEKNNLALAIRSQIKTPAFVPDISCSLMKENMFVKQIRVALPIVTPISLFRISSEMALQASAGPSEFGDRNNRSRIGLLADAEDCNFRQAVPFKQQEQFACEEQGFSLFSSSFQESITTALVMNSLQDISRQDEYQSENTCELHCDDVAISCNDIVSSKSIAPPHTTAAQLFNGSQLFHVCSPPIEHDPPRKNGSVKLFSLMQNVFFGYHDEESVVPMYHDTIQDSSCWPWLSLFDSSNWCSKSDDESSEALFEVMFGQ